ncbi:hypothetical protein KKF05_01155 [Patescibacteria group bacterium]|nr:hypothetical protein [Patescibacteria group bacterium]MBU1028987.1 hypothetical protein [Patescibacteria group bacterium]MBU1916087.1 hypothetical protein [Patescibacteria group bacterium]
MKNIYESNCGDSRMLQHLLEAGYLPPEFDPTRPLHELTGQVTKVDADYIEIKAKPIIFDDPVIYTVLVTSDTAIINRKIKDEKLIEQELAAFDNTLDAFDQELGEPLSGSPMLYTETEINLSDLKIGQDVTVTTDANVRKHSNFIARNITTILGTLDVTQLPPLPPVPENLNEGAITN